MAFPQDVLTADEQVVAHLRPHARVAVHPAVVVVLAAAVTVGAVVMLPANAGGHLGMLVIGAVAVTMGLTRGVWPLLVWRCTHYVFTDERLLMQHGVLTRRRRDVPLAQVNDHAMRQGVLDRMFGSGSLTIESLGERDPVELVKVPGVQRVQTKLYELVEADRLLHRDDEEPEEPEPAPPPRSRWMSRGR